MALRRRARAWGDDHLAGVQSAACDKDGDVYLPDRRSRRMPQKTPRHSINLHNHPGSGETYSIYLYYRQFPLYLCLLAYLESVLYQVDATDYIQGSAHDVKDQWEDARSCHWFQSYILHCLDKTKQITHGRPMFRCMDGVEDMVSLTGTLVHVSVRNAIGELNFLQLDYLWWMNQQFILDFYQRDLQSRAAAFVVLLLQLLNGPVCQASTRSAQWKGPWCAKA